MLKSLVPRLKCPGCGGVKALEVKAFRETAQRLRDGLLTCQGCRAWYPVEDDLLELVRPALLDRDRVSAFCARFAPELARSVVQGDPSPDLTAQLEQRRHFDDFADGSGQSYQDYQHTPFWTAIDDLTFDNWLRCVRPGAWILDIGCADGRSAFRFARRSSVVIGCDISREMIRRAIARAAAEGLEDCTTFFVADASALPFADATFDCACTYGVLHHLPSPGETCREVARILRSRGVFFGSENNASAFRGVFDLLMRLCPLWHELAGREPLISSAMLGGWTADLGVRLRHRTMVFVPPHLCNLLGRSAARVVLRLSNALGGALPWVRGQGGLLVFELEKAAESG